MALIASFLFPAGVYCKYAVCIVHRKSLTSFLSRFGILSVSADISHGPIKTVMTDLLQIFLCEFLCLFSPKFLLHEENQQ